MVGDFLEQVVPSLTHPILRCRNLILCQSQTTLCCVSFTEAAHGPRTFHSIQGIFVSTTPDIETGSEIERKASSQPHRQTMKNLVLETGAQNKTAAPQKERVYFHARHISWALLCAETDRQTTMDGCYFDGTIQVTPSWLFSWLLLSSSLSTGIGDSISNCAEFNCCCDTASRTEKGDDDEREKERKTQKKQNMIL